MNPPRPGAGIERGLRRASRAQLAVHELLARGPVWLQQIFGDPTLPHAGLMPPGRTLEADVWLLVTGRSGLVVQLGLVPSLYEAIGLPQRPRPSPLLALVLQWAAPLMPVLRSFVGEDLELRLEKSPRHGPGDGEWVRFEVSISALRQRLPARMAAGLVPRLHALLQRHRVTRPSQIPLHLFAGTRLRLPVNEVRRLAPGDVLLCEDAPAANARQVQLYIESLPEHGAGRCLASVRAHDGRVEHLAPDSWMPLGTCSEPRGCVVGLHAVEACLTLPVEVCRKLAAGQHIEDWHHATWLERPLLRIGARAVGELGATRLADRPGYEILSLRGAAN